MNSNYFQNKRKIVNDPVYGFITIPNDLVFDLIESHYFQRLRGIKQLGLTFYVYPAAVHTRLQHAMGAVHLMSTALDIIERKGFDLSPEDRLGGLVAILLHDIGHGPFSHALEEVIVQDVNHEELSLLFMQELDRQFDGALQNAIQIFRGEHPRRFLHQLVSSQLDMDRLDYLRRDSFFTGVTEGAVGSERIIKMLRVIDDQLVIDRKGIYSIEKFLIARRLMYWQVYLHKTVTVAEQMLIKVLKRAQLLARSGHSFMVSPVLNLFLSGDQRTRLNRESPETFLNLFTRLDDSDIFSALKSWSDDPDPILSMLASGLVERKLLGIRIQEEPFDQDIIEDVKSRVRKKTGWSDEDVNYLVFTDMMVNDTYSDSDDQVMLWENPGRLVELTQASDIINYAMLSQLKNKYFLCAPKWSLPD